MRLNRRMQRYLDDLRSRRVDAAPLVPGRPPDVEIVEAGGCFLLGRFARKPHLHVADFRDETGLECSANKLPMAGLVDPRLSAAAPLLLLTAGLLTAQAVSQQLAQRPGIFNVIVSYDGESCAVRFHRLRAGQRWLAEDLEDYVDEGVLVVEAGQGARGASLAMLSAAL